MLAEGDILADRYRLEAMLDSAGASTLWAAIDTTSKRPVALKILSEEFPDLPRRIGAFVAAGRRASKAPHPAFVAIRAIGQTDRGIPFLVMERLERWWSLRRLLDAGETLTLDRVLSIMKETLTALAAAHRAGVTHGDVKPDNIMLPSEVCDEQSLRLLNLGLSCPMLAEKDATTPTHIVGTLDYVAPEWLQRPGAQPTPLADVFACGVVMNEMLMGQLPLAPLRPMDPMIETKLADRNSYYMSGHLVPLPTTTFHDLPRKLIDVLSSATAIDPQKRYSDAGQMLEALQTVIDAGLPPDASDRPFVDAATIITDPPFDLEAFRAEHPPPKLDHDAVDERETLILSQKESLDESSGDQDTIELGNHEEVVPDRSPPNPLGDPSGPESSEIVDLAPLDPGASSDEIKTETYRSSKPSLSIRDNLPEGQGLVDVKTVIFEPAEAADEDPIERAATARLEPVVISEGASRPPWLEPAKEEPVDTKRPLPSSTDARPHQPSFGRGEHERGHHRSLPMGLVVALIIVLGFVGVGLIAYILWGF